MAYSHRDRRTHRIVWRGLETLGGAVVLLVLAALLAPEPWLGLVAVVGIGAAGLAALAWGNAVVGSYTADLRRYRDGTYLEGFARAELVPRFGLEQPTGQPSRRSPHHRPGAPPDRPPEAESVEAAPDEA